MRKHRVPTLFLLGPAAIQAHKVLIERDGTSPAHFFLGEPAEAPPPGGDPEFAKLIAPTIRGYRGNAPPQIQTGCHHRSKVAMRDL
jgi:hypothetical protein